jgi:hypothetical protein
VAGETTALVIFSPRSVFEELRGPAYSRLWRPGFLAALVEKHVPVWVITPISYAAKSEPAHEIVTCNPDLAGPLETNLMPIMASLFDQGNGILREKAESEGVIKSKGSSWWINGHWVSYGVDEEFDAEGEILDRVENGEFKYPSSKIYEMSTVIVAEKCRVTSMSQPGSILNTTNGIAWMRSQGFDVDEFVYKSAGVTD